MANPFPITDNNEHFGLTLLTDLRFMSQVIKTLLNFNPTLCPLNPIASTSMHPKNHGYGNKKLLVNVTINNARLRLNCSLCLSLGTTPIIEHRWHTQAHQRKQKKESQNGSPDHRCLEDRQKCTRQTASQVPCPPLPSLKAAIFLISSS